MATLLRVSLSPQAAVAQVSDAVRKGSFTGECVECSVIPAPGGTECVLAVYEKHMFRAGNRLTLTLLAENFSGETRVRCISGGGGEGFFRFDWGASDSFEQSVRKALAAYLLSEA